MKASLGLLAPLAGLLLAGCSRSNRPDQQAPQGSIAVTNLTSVRSASAPEPRDALNPAKPLPPPPPSVAARAANALRQNISGEANAFLTSELHNFIQASNRLPASFAEFAGARLDSIPRPPKGKKWVIDAADLQVKAVAR